LFRQRCGKGHALIEAAAAAVDGQQGNAGTSLLNLDRAAGRVDHPAALSDPANEKAR